jgi:hypothetical protein
MDVIFFEVSARSGFNINEAFTDLSQRMLEKGQQRKASGFRITGSIKSHSYTMSIKGDPRLQTPGD